MRRVREIDPYINEEKFFKYAEEDAAINEHLIDRVSYIDDDSLLHDETFQYSQEELLDLSETYRIALNMNKKELAVFVVAALTKFPFMVLQCVAEFLIEERGKRNG